MGSHKIELYDVSPKMREVIEWRAARRKTLREKYLREILHPTKQNIVIDEALHRYNALKLTQEYYTKLTSKALLVTGIVTFISVFGIAGFFMREKNRQEHRLRTGQVSYADREFKFA